MRRTDEYGRLAKFEARRAMQRKGVFAVVIAFMLIAAIAPILYGVYKNSTQSGSSYTHEKAMEQLRQEVARQEEFLRESVNLPAAQKDRLDKRLAQDKFLLEHDLAPAHRSGDCYAAYRDGMDVFPKVESKRGATIALGALPFMTLAMVFVGLLGGILGGYSYLGGTTKNILAAIKRKTYGRYRISTVSLAVTAVWLVSFLCGLAPLLGDTGAKVAIFYSNRSIVTTAAVLYVVRAAAALALAQIMASAVTAVCVKTGNLRKGLSLIAVGTVVYVSAMLIVMLRFSSFETEELIYVPLLSLLCVNEVGLRSAALLAFHFAVAAGLWIWAYFSILKRDTPC